VRAVCPVTEAINLFIDRWRILYIDPISTHSTRSHANTREGSMAFDSHPQNCVTNANRAWKVHWLLPHLMTILQLPMMQRRIRCDGSVSQMVSRWGFRRRQSWTCAVWSVGLESACTGSWVRPLYAVLSYVGRDNHTQLKLGFGSERPWTVNTTVYMTFSSHKCIHIDENLGITSRKNNQQSLRP
jgi:hypothetical protein